MTRDEKLERAGEYVLGLLEGADHEAFEAEMTRDKELADIAASLAARLQSLDETATGEADPTIWASIERRIGTLPQLPPQPANDDMPAHFPRWALAAASLVLAVAVGFTVGQNVMPSAARPTVVAVLVNQADQSPGAIIEAFTDDRVHIVPLEQFEVPVGNVLQVWTLPDPTTGPVSLGTLGVTREAELHGPELPPPVSGQLYEITLEPAPGSPTGRPTGPILVKGYAKAPI